MESYDEFKVLSNSSADVISQLINKHISEGWYVAGNLVTCSHTSSNFPFYSILVGRYRKW